MMINKNMTKESKSILKYFEIKILDIFLVIYIYMHMYAYIYLGIL